MGNIKGSYDSKGEGFAEGCSSLHNTFTAHGPDRDAYDSGMKDHKNQPHKLSNQLSFMFETCFGLRVPTFSQKDMP